MRSIQTGLTVPLGSIKPLEGLLRYRAHCVAEVARALEQGPGRIRERSPVSGALLKPIGEIDGLPYGRCPDGGGWFLMRLTESARWGGLLEELSRYRHSAQAFHSEIASSRREHVYAPKLAWIRDTLRLHEIAKARLLEVATPPSDFTSLLEEGRQFAGVTTVNETALLLDGAEASGAVDAAGSASSSLSQTRMPAEEIRGYSRIDQRGSASHVHVTQYHAAVLLESLDRVDDPAGLVRAVRKRLIPGGLLFVTALAASGFDMTVLGLRNAYLYPPDRTNCFSRRGLEQLIAGQGFELLEVSTPGVLDCDVVQAHRQHDPSLALSAFERSILDADAETRQAFQTFLQQQGLSSFARLVARKR